MYIYLKIHPIMKYNTFLSQSKRVLVPLGKYRSLPTLTILATVKITPSFYHRRYRLSDNIRCYCYEASQMSIRGTSLLPQ